MKVPRNCGQPSSGYANRRRTKELAEVVSHEMSKATPGEIWVGPHNIFLWHLVVNQGTVFLVCGLTLNSGIAILPRVVSVSLYDFLMLHRWTG